MSFTTFAFALFLAAFYLLYFLLPSKIRWVVLIPANLIFYCAAGVKELPFMLAAAVLSYIAGRFLQRVQDRYAAEREKHRGTEAAAARKQLKQAKERRSRFILIAVLIPVMGIWAFFKADRTGSFTAPFAISYYTFIAVSYCADVFRGRHRCETNFLKFFAFLTFFPQMVEGPISRYETVGKAITEPHGFSFDRFGEGVVRAMWGYIKKMVLADRLWKIIAYVYGLADPTGPQVLMIVLLLPLQQFADFSGCMDIALGFAHAMGIDLQENFRQPIFSRSIEEVWRRWHITLGAFCRDYIFYPVSLLKPLARASKKLSVKHPKAGRLLPVLVSLTAVWTFMGLWHGFAWKYLIWGWMNLFFIAGGNIFKEQYAHLRTVFRVRQDSPAYSLFAIARTYLLFGFMELVSDGSSAGSALHFLRRMFSASGWHAGDTAGEAPVLVGTALQAGLGIPDLWIIAVFTALCLAAEICKERGKPPLARFSGLPALPRCLLDTAMLFCILMLALTASEAGTGFAYARF